MRVAVFCCFLLVSVLGQAQNQNTLSKPYQESEIILKTTVGDINGTLLLPAQNQAVPVALLISGSGPTDRNGNNPAMTNNSLKLLAEELAANGIATVRYDKRGIGKSVVPNFQESNLRFETYISDATVWLKMLQKDKRFTKVAVIGHSEGSLIGLEAAATTQPYAFVSIAGAAQTADSLILGQVATQPEVVKNEVSTILAQLKQGKEVTQFSPYLAPLFRSSVQPYIISWLKYSPQAAIAKIKGKVLIIQGTTDLQITASQAKQLAKAKPGAQLLLIDNMNHVLKNVPADQQANIAAYNNPSLPLASELAPAIVKFLR